MTHNTVNEISGYIIYYTHNIYIQESCGKRSDSQWAIVYIYINNLLEKVYHKWRPWWRHLRNHPLFSRDTVHDYIPCCQLLTSCLWDNNGKHNRSVLFSTIFLHKFIAHGFTLYYVCNAMYYKPKSIHKSSYNGYKKSINIIVKYFYKIIVKLAYHTLLS